MSIVYEYTSVEYHSHLWSILTAVGWVTMTVDDGVARMCPEDSMKLYPAGEGSLVLELTPREALELITKLSEEVGDFVQLGLNGIPLNFLVEVTEGDSKPELANFVVQLTSPKGK